MAKYNQGRKLLASSILMAAYSAGGNVYAQETANNALEEVIITGRAGGAEITQFESSVSITTFDEERLREAGAASAAELLGQVPGVWAEPSGGEAGNNVFVRGIPANGQYLFSKISVDGLPVFEEIGDFAPMDGLFKIDETFERLEVVRGGSASIFASNAPGGIFNYIHKRASDTFEGVVKYQVADYNSHRADLFLTGPVNDKWNYALGGFYRVSDGQRDAGFTGDDGGQFRLALTRELDKGEFTIYGHKIDDKNIFYLPFPLAAVGNGDPKALPGQDALTDTNVSRFARYHTFYNADGSSFDADITDGIHSRATNFGTEFSWEFDNGWNISNKNRFTSGQSTLNSHIILGTGASTADLRADSLAALQAIDSNVTAVTLTKSDGTAFTDPSYSQGSFFHWDSTVSSFTNDLQLFKAFETGAGVHNFTAGLYLSRYDFKRENRIDGFLQETKGSPQLISVAGVNAAGDVLATCTVNGGYNNLGLAYVIGFESSNEVNALYISDEWEVNDSLRIDLAARYENQQFEGITYNAVNAENVLDARLPVPTTADDSINTRGVGGTPFSQDQDEFAFSIGANYVVSDAVSVYARYSDSFRTPTVITLAGSAGNTDGIPVNEIEQIEGGVKLNMESVQAFITLFQSEFGNARSNDPITAPDGSVQNLSAELSSTTSGVETEFEFGPFGPFSANLKATFQKPEIDEYSVAGATGEAAAAAASVSGNRPRRMPEVMIAFRPKFSFETANGDGSVFLNIFHTDDRFEDVGNQVVLPSYTTVGLGATYNMENGVEWTLIGSNLTDEIALTEGNPRALGSLNFGAQATSDFARPLFGRNFRLSVAYRF